MSREHRGKARGKEPKEWGLESFASPLALDESYIPYEILNDEMREAIKNVVRRVMAERTQGNGIRISVRVHETDADMYPLLPTTGRRQK